MSSRFNHDYQQRIEYERIKTTREWVNQLNKNEGGHPAVRSFESRRNFKDFSGFLQYKRSNTTCRGTDSKDFPPLSKNEIEGIQKCFSMADIYRTGYLDCEGLKAFMEYRKTPITHLEAKNLIYKTDPEYNRFINLEQILTLAFHTGLGTGNERKISSKSFTDIIQNLKNSSTNLSRDRDRERERENWAPYLRADRSTKPIRSECENWAPYMRAERRTQSAMVGECENWAPYMTADRNTQPMVGYPRFQTFQSNVVEENLELHGAISYFEDMAIQVKAKTTEENLYRKYRHEIRQKKSKTKEPEFPSIFSNMVLPSQDPTCQEKQRSVNKLKKEWENKWPRPEKEEIEGKSSLDRIKFCRPVPIRKCRDMVKERKQEKVKERKVIPLKYSDDSEKDYPENWAVVPYVKSEESTHIILPPSPPEEFDKVSNVESSSS